MKIIIHEEPPTVTAQQKGETIIRGRIHHYTKPAVKAARDMLTCWLINDAPERPLDGALQLRVRWAYKATKTHPAGTWRTVRPDTDNLTKLLKDVLTDCGYYVDDSRVCHEVIQKCYEDEPSLTVILEPLGEILPL